MADQLIKLADDLGVIRNLTEAVLMAAHGLGDDTERKAMCALVDVVGDKINDAEALLTAHRMGGADV